MYMVVLLVGFSTPAVATDEAVLDEKATAIYAEVLSPFCPGRLLSDCPSGAARDLKKEIRAKLELGQSREQIIDSLYTLYGEDIRAAPEFSEFGIVAWVAPIIFLLVGFVIILAWLKLSKKNTVDSASEEAPF
jgi:cytochrome c-type biogenesis protein CcmH